MSNNIVTSIDYTVLTQQQYRTDDILLIQSTQIATEFNPETDNIEVFVYDLNNQIVATDYNFINYQTYQDSTNTIGPQFVLNNIKIDPVADLESYFFDSGEYIINYNFYREFFSSSVNTPFFIKEISPSRTELRLDTNYLTNDQLVSASFEFSSSRFGRQFDDFYLNLGVPKRTTTISEVKKLNESETGTIGEFIKFAIKNLGIQNPPRNLAQCHSHPRIIYFQHCA